MPKLSMYNVYGQSWPNYSLVKEISSYSLSKYMIRIKYLIKYFTSKLASILNVYIC